MRMVIQKDIDVQVLPAVTGGMLYFPGAIQNPDGTREDMENIPGELIQNHRTCGPSDPIKEGHRGQDRLVSTCLKSAWLL
jgi:hypothetical protein